MPAPPGHAPGGGSFGNIGGGGFNRPGGGGGGRASKALGIGSRGGGRTSRTPGAPVSFGPRPGGVPTGAPRARPGGSGRPRFLADFDDDELSNLTPEMLQWLQSGGAI